MADLARSRRAAALTALLVGTALPVALDTRPATAASVVDVIAWAPYWEANDALVSFQTNKAQLGELTPFFWTVTSPTSIVLNSAISATKLAQYKTAAAEAGKPFVATIVDAMPARGMAGVLADSATRAQHVQTIVDFVQAGGFTGVDIDYEKFAFSDGKSSWPATHDYWGAFLTELSTTLHAGGKTLAVAVPPIYNSDRNPDSGYWVYNFAVLAAVVDRVRVMTYSYSVASAGPIAPYEWVVQSMNAAKAIVPATKLVMGIPAYGTDWVTKIDGDCPSGISPTKRSVTTNAAAAWAAAKGVKPAWDAVKRERTFSYIDSFTGSDGNGYTVRCNVTRTVWYADADAIYERVKLAQSLDLVGVAMWALGYDDAITWEGIAAARSNNQSWKAPELPTPTPRPPPLPPITSPTTPLPARFLDTRKGSATTDGQHRGIGRLEAGQALEVDIAGRGTVADDAVAVTLNVTVIGEGNGFVTVYPCGARPTTSSLNVRSGQIISNSVITRLSDVGSVCLFTQSPAHLVVDVFNVLRPRSRPSTRRRDCSTRELACRRSTDSLPAAERSRRGPCSRYRSPAVVGWTRRRERPS
ncbi:MAG: glycosyl hydrolase family 18 protein [Ilumatobacteraceae bacterium]